MSKKILYYSGSSEHPYFKNEFRFLKTVLPVVPSNQKFLSEEVEEDLNRWGFVREKAFSKFARWIRGFVLRTVLAVWFPKIVPLRGPWDAVWSCGYIVLGKPFVVTFEDVTVFFFHNYTGYNPINRWIVKTATRYFLARPDCLAILPWTDAAKKSFESIFPNDPILANKTHVLLPSLREKNSSAKGGTKTKNILFIGASFLEKWGYELLLAFERISDPSARLTILSANVPEFAMRLVEKDSRICVRKFVSEEEKEKLFQNAYCLAMTSHMDTLWFVFLEAKSYRVPCITTQNFAAWELIRDGIDGFVISNHVSYFNEKNVAVNVGKIGDQLRNPPEWFIQTFSEKLQFLLENEGIRDKLGQSAMEDVKSGRFSFSREKQREIVNFFWDE